MKDGSVEEPLPGQVFEIGTVAMIHRVVRAPDNTLQVVVQGLERLKVEYWLGAEPYLRAYIALAPDIVQQDVELEALERSLRELAQEVIALSPNMPEDAGKFLDQVQDSRYLAYLIAANSH